MIVDNFTKEQVKAALGEQSFMLIDVREHHEYTAGHIAGAFSLPLSIFSTKLIPHTCKIVLYCQTGRRTLRALEIAQLEGRMDITCHYAGSFHEWSTTGEFVETEPLRLLYKDMPSSL